MKEIYRALKLSPAQICLSVGASLPIVVLVLWGFYLKARGHFAFEMLMSWQIGVALVWVIFIYSQISFVFKLYSDRLEFHQFGFRKWRVPVCYVGTTALSEYQVSIWDTRTGRVRAVLNQSDYRSEDIVKFAELLDEYRIKFGVHLDEPKLRGVDWVGVLISNTIMLCIIVAVVVALPQMIGDVPIATIIHEEIFVLARLAGVLTVIGALIVAIRWLFHAKRSR
ncbi:hypothetical protein [Phenylobacterium aquaticum]|uniref:hypothetical protein n=1 Tax=Phenylobacterium aquaticum TaxID=1763816 RepID=UPI0026EA964D|nr:hypothetical protein [Phenylobacterium aquaticum]